MSNLPQEEFRCEGDGCNKVITQQQAEKVKKVLGKELCPDCARKESAESMDAAMTPRDKVFAWLARNNFEEQRTIKGFFILAGPTKIAVDMSKPSDVFQGAPVIGRLEVNGDVTEEGHGIARIDDVRQTIMGLLKGKGAGQKNGKKETKPAPEPKDAEVVQPEMAVMAPHGTKEGNRQRNLPALKEDTPLSTDIIQKYINPKATEQEAFVFLQLCKARGLNPFLREAYLIKYGDSPASMVVGKDAFTRKAEESGQLDGYEAGIVVLPENGDNWEDREGTILAEEEKLVGGLAKVYRKDMKKPFHVRVSLREYDKGKNNWASMPATMIRKVALVQALREAFTKELGGCYDGSEIGTDEPQAQEVK